MLPKIQFYTIFFNNLKNTVQILQYLVATEFNVVPESLPKTHKNPYKQSILPLTMNDRSRTNEQALFRKILHRRGSKLLKKASLKLR